MLHYCQKRIAGLLQLKTIFSCIYFKYILGIKRKEISFIPNSSFVLFSWVCFFSHLRQFSPPQLFISITLEVPGLFLKELCTLWEYKLGVSTSTQLEHCRESKKTMLSSSLDCSVTFTRALKRSKRNKNTHGNKYIIQVIRLRITWQRPSWALQLIGWTFYAIHFASK